MKKTFKNDQSVGSGGKWYDEYPKGEEPHKHTKTDFEVLNLKDEAKRYLDADTAAFQNKQSKSRDSETAWLKTALTQGTTSDKVAAGIVLIQDNPKFNLSRLVSLVNQVRVSKHNQSSMIITSLRDLFLSDLLHPTYKLLKFEEQNLDDIGKETESDGIIKVDTVKKKLLAHWYFEDQLKEQYEKFVTSLGAIASDTVDVNRETSISVMTDLLIGNPEQEHKLLELIVNKVGDPSSKVGSKAVFCLNKLLHEHPNMKIVVLREIEKLLFRKNVGTRAQYYAICLLTQFLLSKDDAEIAATLIEVYFAFFKACLKKGEPDSRMMAAILTGVNRAYPFAQVDSNMLREHIDSVYKVIHIGSFNVSLNALSLLHQVIGREEAQASRFYSAFYRKLSDPEIGIANKRAIFLNLLYRVLQNDNSIQRLYAFIKRILQVVLYFPANMACATLYVVSKVLNTHKGLKNILFDTKSSIKIEKDGNETIEIKEETLSSGDSDSEVEECKELETSIMLSNLVVKTDTDSEVKPDKKEELDVKIEPNVEKQYDPFCRNPLYAGITKGFNTELLTLARHYHPSVALFASTILEGKPINYTGDPLEDLALMRFLDRYVFKNPKKLEEKKVQRHNDPLAKRAGYTPKGIRRLPVDSTSYLNEKEERIPVDELFLYRYLKGKQGLRHRSKTDNDDDDDDLESVNSEEFNEVLDKLGDGKDFEELDIAADIETGKKKPKKRSKADESDEDDEDDEDEESDAGGASLSEDEHLDGEEDEEGFEDLDDIEDEDLSDIDFDDDSNNDENISDDDGPSTKKKNKKQQGHGKISGKGHKKGIDENIFVSAEKFAEMLEQQSHQKTKHGGTNAFSDADGASLKQLDWEMKRHQKLKGSFHKNKRKGSQPFKKNVKKMKR